VLLLLIRFPLLNELLIYLIFDLLLIYSFLARIIFAGRTSSYNLYSICLWRTAWIFLICPGPLLLLFWCDVYTNNWNIFDVCLTHSLDLNFSYFMVKVNDWLEYAPYLLILLPSCNFEILIEDILINCRIVVFVKCFSVCAELAYSSGNTILQLADVVVPPLERNCTDSIE